MRRQGCFGVRALASNRFTFLAPKPDLMYDYKLHLTIRTLQTCSWEQSVHVSHIEYKAGPAQFICRTGLFVRGADKELFFSDA